MNSFEQQLKHEYLPPSQQPTASNTASQQAKEELQATLLADGRSAQGTTSTLSAKEIQKGTHLPNSYDATGGISTYTSTISRDPSVYSGLFQQAKQEALRHELDMPEADDADRLMLHIQAIQQAINTSTGTQQDDAEQQLEHLTKTTLENGETDIPGDRIQEHGAEVCTIKSTIAAVYLSEQFPEIDRTVQNMQAYNGNDDGHQALTFTYQGNTYTYHPNSPQKDQEGNRQPNIHKNA